MLLEGKLLKGKELESLKKFLERMNLGYDQGIEYSACILNDNYEIIGTGSVDQNVIKCVAIDPEYQGQGLAAAIISNLVQYLFEKERTHIFIYTKPNNLAMFTDMGFYKILETPDILFMENRSQEFLSFLRELREETPREAYGERCKIGAVVANCNPFTLGHQYLLKKSLEQCDYLHLFILSDNRSTFSAMDRYQMVKEGIKSLDRIILHRTSDYMVSAATFPTYFFKDQAFGERANCRLDLALFASRIAPELHITRRFVGTEPYCEVTKAYNEELKKELPVYGIAVTEIERKTEDDIPISASEVRRCITRQDYEQMKKLVPDAVYEYLKKML
ncbi:MAG: [citrate (pro-3S)-lyase] ligase [Lachnospiraceae bacterium]|nr:[citrate (pro-3S)-lyase] ligase [Lachnospiraceae bacterium]